ncbi:corrinoid protein [Chloroflexota bacterium]|nr:corrinoid protein [Chloroflexota bacterium]
MAHTLEIIFNAILEGDRGGVTSGIEAAFKDGIDPAVILNEGMVKAMSEVGHRFEIGDYFVPEMLISARAMQAGLSLLRPKLKQNGVKSRGKVVIGTVKGDLHDIGKNLVSMMLEGAGYEITDLGADVAPEVFVNAVRSEGPEILALSALLTTTMPSMESTIKAIQDAGLRDHVKIIVGGAPLTEAYAREIGADGYSPDASRAVALANSLLA